MRWAILCISILATSLQVHAQQDSTTVQQPDERIMFSAEVRELSSYLRYNNERAAQMMFDKVVQSMQAFTDATKAAADTAKGTDKRKLSKTLEQQRQLLAQFKTFRPNVLRNRSSIETWADQFIKTLYAE